MHSACHVRRYASSTAHTRAALQVARPLLRMSGEVTKLEEEVRELFAQNRHYIGEIDALRAENKVLQSQNEELLVAAKHNADHLELLQKTVEHLVAITTKGLRDADSTPDTAETDGRRD